MLTSSRSSQVLLLSLGRTSAILPLSDVSGIEMGGPGSSPIDIPSPNIRENPPNK